MELDYCEMSAPDLDQGTMTDVTYSCVKCRDNAIALVEFNNKRTLNRVDMKYKKPIPFSPLSFQPALQCKLLTAENVLGDLSDGKDEVEHCELYYSLPKFGSGCLKCEHGYSGEVVNYVHMCEIYSSLTSCKKCQPGYYPKKPHSCVRVN